MAPGGGGEPTGDLAQAIDSELGGLDKFKEDFEAAGATRFGSGWAWLCTNDDGSLCVCSTRTRRHLEGRTPIPLMFGNTPIT